MTELHVYRKNADEVQVKAKIEIEPSPDQSLRFKLAEGFEIEKILDADGEPLAYERTEKIAEPYSFAADTNLYTVKHVPGASLEIRYAGSSTGQHTMINEDIISLNYCSAWYPHRLSCALQAPDVTVYISAPEDCKVMEAVFDEENGRWCIGDHRLDREIFIISFCRCREMKNDVAAIYYYGEDNDEIARDLIRSAPQLKDYFTELFGGFDMEPVKIFSLPIDVNYGGYNYNGNLIYDRFILDFDTEEMQPYHDLKQKHGISKNLIYALGHELAHNRCQGAAGNWEAWLNETTADWAVFSYLIEQGDEALVSDLINLYIAFEEDEKIRTDDGKRPQQYHSKGSILFYKIYQKYGLELIKKLLRAFTDLEHKTTAAWLAEIEKISPALSKRMDECLSLERLGDLEF